MTTEIADQARAQEILDSLELPPELTTINAELGLNADQELALKISFRVRPGIELDPKTVAPLGRFMLSVADQLLRSGITLFPYVSLDEAA